MVNYPYNVMVKPIGSQCNLNCTYCFYLRKQSLYPEETNWRMTDETLEAFISQYAQQRSPVINLAWQGGEPTLMGPEFLQKGHELLATYLQPGQRVESALQTNGTLINDDWGRFLKKYNYLVGVSIDGPAHLHDHYRVTKNGQPTHARVMAGLEVLKKYKVEYNMLVLLNAVNAEHPEEVYRFVKENGIQHFQVIPCLEYDKEGNIAEYSVRPEQYARFLNTIFDLWYPNDIGNVFVQVFELTLGSYMGMPAGLCLFSERCGRAMIIEHNGDIYSCDHFVDEDHFLGNVHQQSLESMLESPRQLRFREDKADLSSECGQCRFLRLCRGGCPEHRIVAGADGHRHNYFCHAYHEYFSYTQERFQKIAQRLRGGQGAAPGAAPPSKKKIGRNDPCPCGSGKKYKNCHGRT